MLYDVASQVEQKERKKAYRAGDYEYDYRKYSRGNKWGGYGKGWSGKSGSGKQWEPSDLEKIIGKSPSMCLLCACTPLSLAWIFANSQQEI